MQSFEIICRKARNKTINQENLFLSIMYYIDYQRFRKTALVDSSVENSLINRNLAPTSPPLHPAVKGHFRGKIPYFYKKGKYFEVFSAYTL